MARKIELEQSHARPQSRHRLLSTHCDARSRREARDARELGALVETTPSPLKLQETLERAVAKLPRARPHPTPGPRTTRRRSMPPATQRRATRERRLERFEDGRTRVVAAIKREEHDVVGRVRTARAPARLMMMPCSSRPVARTHNLVATLASRAARAEAVADDSFWIQYARCLPSTFDLSNILGLGGRGAIRGSAERRRRAAGLVRPRGACQRGARARATTARALSHGL